MTTLDGATVVITGGGSGIGAAMARRFDDERPARIVVADIDVEAARSVADRLISPSVAHRIDVTDGAAVRSLIDEISSSAHIDLYCSNAGIATGAGIDATAAAWQRSWEVNVMGSVHAAAALLGHCTHGRRTRLLITASAAGLLVNLGDAPYTATKHAAVGLAEWLSIHHFDDGLDVACLCPQGVRTPMVTGGLEQEQLAAEVVNAMGLIEPEQCADAVVDGLEAGRSLILPHPEVADYVRHKADDHRRWIGGMRKLRRRLMG